MAKELPELSAKIIGVVKNEMKEPGGRSNIQEIVSEIELDESLAGSMDHLDEFSYVTVLYWAHKDSHPGAKPNRIYPHRQETNPLVGVFATRSSDRPNRIGMCTAKILEVGDTTLKVSACDAIDGSPVIDIKPYNPRHDSRTDSKEIPVWG